MSTKQSMNKNTTPALPPPRVTHQFPFAGISRTSMVLVVGAVVLAISGAILNSSAAPPVTPYTPGSGSVDGTLAPTCAPGDVNCTVIAPAISGVNDDITELTGLTTALSVAQGGTGITSISANTLLGAQVANTIAPVTLSTKLQMSGLVLDVNETNFGFNTANFDTAVDGRISAQGDVVGGFPVLDAGLKIATSAIPTYPLGAFSQVADQTAREALVATAGDIAIQTDNGFAYLFVGPTNTDWVQLTLPAGVTSVNGDIGVVVLTLADLTGTLPVSQGGTGLTAAPTNGQLLIGNGTDYTLSTLTAGANITITNSAGGITIAAAGGGGGSNTFDNGLTLTGIDVDLGGPISVDTVFSIAGNNKISIQKATAGTGTIFEVYDETGDTTPFFIADNGDVNFGGKIIIFDNTTFETTFQPSGAQVADVTYTLPANDGNASDVLTTDGSGVLSWAPAAGGSSSFTDLAFEVKDDGDVTKLLKFSLAGNTAGVTGTIVTEFTANRQVTIPDNGTDYDLVGDTTTQTLQNKTLGTATAVAIGGDATGDVYYRNAGGALTRLAIGTAGQVLAVNGTATAPEWVAAPGGALSTLTDVTLGATAAGQILVRNAGDTAWVNVAVSGDATLAATGALTLNTVSVPKGGTGLTTIPTKSVLVANTLDTLTAATATSPANDGHVLTFNGTNIVWAAAAGGLSDSDYGDITVSGSGTVMTIDANAVTLAKIATIADQTILGNNSGGAASPIALTAAQAKTVLAIAQADVAGLTTASSPTFDGLTLTTTDLAVTSGGTGSSTGSITGTGALVFTAGGAANDLTLVSAGTGDVIAKPGTDSTNAFQLQQADGTVVLAFDSINEKVGLRDTGTGFLTYFKAGDQTVFNSDITYILPINDGTAGQVLTTDGVDGNAQLSWTTVSSLTDGDKGDITVSAGGATWTIDANAVTLAKIATIADQTILGNNSGGAASPIALTAAQAKTVLAIAQADVAGLTTASSPSFTGLTISGTTGAILKTDGSGVVSAAVAGTDYETPITFSTGLTDAANTVTNNLSTGVAGGQSVTGGTAASEALTLVSTTHGTKGKILFGTSAYDELNDRLGIGTATPAQTVSVAGTFGIIEGGGGPSDYTIFQGGTQTANITYTLPTAQGAAGTVLTNVDGAGTLGWAATGSANTALSNLTATSINQALIPDGSSTRDLGSTALGWKDVHVGGSAAGSFVLHNDATNTLRATFAFDGSTAELSTDTATPIRLVVGTGTGGINISTGNIVTLEPNATGNALIIKGFGGGSNNFIVTDTGNVTAAGTLAVNGDSITADGATLTINAAGAVDIQDALTADSLTLDTGSLTLNGVAVDITTGTDEDLVLQPNGTGQLIAQTSTATDDQIQLTPNAGGAARFKLILTSADITTADKTIILPDYSLTFPAADAAGALTSNGAGVLSWTAVFNPASIASNLVPSADDTYDLGSDSNRWQDLYLNGATIHIGDSGDEATIGYTLATDTLALGSTAIALNGAVTTTGSLTFSGVATDITSAATEDLTIQSGTTGKVILKPGTGGDADGAVTIQDEAGTPIAKFDTRDTGGGLVGQIIAYAKTGDPARIGAIGATGQSAALALVPDNAFGEAFSITANDGGDVTYAASTGVNLFSGVSAGSASVRIGEDSDSAGSEYVGLSVAADVSASYTLTLPAAVGASGQTLVTTDGSGTLGWTTPFSPASIGANLIPDGNDTRDIGSDGARWANIYLGGETIHIGASGDEATIGYNTTFNNLTLDSDLVSLDGNVEINGGSLTIATMGAGIVTSDSGGTLASVATIAGSSITADDLTLDQIADSLALDATLTLTADGTEEVILTNTGSGLSFRVNDVGSDTTPFVIDADGNVGVGTTSPGSVLDIERSSANHLIVLGNNTAGDVRSRMGYVNGSGNARSHFLSVNATLPTGTVADDNDTYGSAALILSGDTIDDGPAFSFNAAVAAVGNNTLGTRMVITQNGKVGIGTDTPANRLDVEGGAAIGATYSGTNAAPTNGLIVQGNVGIGTASPLFTTPTGNALTVVGPITGNVEIGGTQTSTDGAIAQLSFHNSSATTTAFKRVAMVRALNEDDAEEDAGSLAFYTANDAGTEAEKMRITGDGNVGIGDTSPAALFTVGSGDLFQVNSSGDIVTAAAESLSITTGTTGAITLDSGTTGTVNIGTGTGGAKSINIGTGAVVNTLLLGNVTAGTGITLQANPSTGNGIVNSIGGGLTSGSGVVIASAATGVTSGFLLDVNLTGANTGHTGAVARINNSNTSSTGTALYVVNNGDNASTSFRVDDVSSDTTPIVISSSGRMILGGTGTFGGEKLRVMDGDLEDGANDGDGNAILSLESFDDSDGSSGYIRFRKSSNDTVGTFSATQNGESLGRIEFSGVDSSGDNVYDGAAVIRSTQTAASATTVSANLEFLTTNSSGTFGSRMTIDDDGAVTIVNLGGDPGTTSAVCADTNGLLTKPGSTCPDPSDERLKKNIIEISSERDVLSDLDKLRGVYFNWKTELPVLHDFKEDRQTGLIAQDIEKIMPEVIEKGDDGYLSVHYNKLAGFFIEVDKAQQAQIKGIHGDIEAIKKVTEGLSNVKAKVDSLSNEVLKIASIEGKISTLEDKVEKHDKEIENLKKEVNKLRREVKRK